MLNRLPQLLLACCLACLAAAAAATAGRSQSPEDSAQPRRTQTGAERSALIGEAERNQFTVRRVEFLGNSHTRHHVLARRVAFQEGDQFTTTLLERSLRDLSRLRIIKPVGLKDVDIHLDREDRQIDLNILIRERRRLR